jgi:hypothetical protein
MTIEEFEAIEGRLSAVPAEPLEWGQACDGTCYIRPFRPADFSPPWSSRGCIAALPPSARAEADAKFFAHAREDMVRLVQEVKKWRECS